MPTVTKTNARKLPDPPFDGVPYGNAAKLHYSFATDASGVMVDSDSAVAVADGDKVILGVTTCRNETHRFFDDHL